MASLTGQLVAETYKALLKTIDNDILTASEKQITDGFGGGSNVFIDSQGFLRANKYKVTNGLATQFLKADGSLDANTYLTGITSSQIISALGYTPVPTTRTLTINGTTYDLSANRSWTIDGTSAMWGNISGTLSNQTDLQNALNAKYNNPTGTISQYIRGDGSLATFPALTGFVPYTGATANVDLGEYSLSAEYLAIDTDTTHSTDVGEIVWNPIDGTFDMGLLNGVVLQAGQELHFYGKASGAIGNGKAVMFAGVEGDHLLMSLADPATINANPQYFIGVATQDFANNDFGYITVLGKVRNLDTTAFTLGSVLYFDSASATDGLLTETQPIAPNAKIEVAAVVRVHATQGTLMVRPHIMPKMSMIQDVYIADPANNHGLFYDLANGYWENKSIASALGYTPQAQLNGTGFVKASGTTITYDNSTYLTTTDAASTYQRLDKMVSNLLASATEYPNSNAVINALALKADALNPVFTGYMTISGAEPKLYFTDTDQNPDYFIGADAGFFRIYDQTAGATRFVINSSGVTTIAGDLIVGTIAKSGGTATQFLKADGSIDSSTYVSSAVLADYLLSATAASTYQRLDKMVSNLLASDTEYPNSNAVLAKLALKADAANPVFTGDMTISGISPKLYFTDTDNNPDYTLFVDSGYFYIYDQTAGATKFQITPSGNAINTGTLTSASFIKSGGTSSQFLMADGSVSTGVANTITGSLNTGYVPKATGANTLANSLIYSDTSLVYIGATTTNRIEFYPVANAPRFSIEGGGSSDTAAASANIRIFDITNNRGWTNQIDTSYNYSYFSWNGTAWSKVAYITPTGSANFAGTVGADTFQATNFVNAYNRFKLYFNSTGTIAAQLYENGASTNGGCLELYGKASGTVDTVISAAPTQLNYINNAANFMIGYNTDQGYKLAVNGAGYFSGSITSASNVIIPSGLEYVWGGGSVSILGNTSTNSLELRTNNSTKLTIASTGAATFSSTVRVNGGELTVYNGASVMYTGVDTGNNYVYFGTNTASYGISFQANGDRMRIFSNGNVAINTTTDAGYKLDVKGEARIQGGGSVNYAVLNLLDNTSGGSNWAIFSGYPALGDFTIRESGVANHLVIAKTTGNVGIGTSNLPFKLNIESTSEAVARIKSTNASGAARLILNPEGAGAGSTGDASIFFDCNTSAWVSGVDKSDSSRYKIAADPYGDFRGGVHLSIDNVTDRSNVVVGGTTVINNAAGRGNLTINGSSTSIFNLSIGSQERGYLFHSGTEMQLWNTANGDVTVAANNSPVGYFKAVSNGSRAFVVGEPTALATSTNRGNITINGGSNSILAFGVNNNLKGYLYNNNVNFIMNTGTGDFIFETNTATPMTITSGGFVGIRRTPNVQFDVNGSTNGINLETNVTATGAVTPYFTILESGVSRTMTGYNYDVTTPLAMIITQTAETTLGLWRASDNATGSTLRGMKSRGTGAAPISPNNGDVLFSVEGWAIHGAGPNYPKFGGGMRFVKDDAFGTANTVAPARTEFVNAFNTTSSQITMTILPNGNVTALGSMTSTSFFESSDFRLKTLINDNPIIHGIEHLEAKLYEKNGKIELGYFAQDAEIFMPYAVTKNADGFLNLSYREVHTAKIARLEKRVAELEKQLNLI